MLKVIKDIRIWIFLFFLIRMYGITLPPLDKGHNWRQTTVTMVARNFVETEANIFYPRIDFAGEKTGITGMEFPLLNYLIYLFSMLFGYDHWYGRLINLMISSAGIWYFFLLVRKYFNERMAFNASIILLSSIWFAYSRKIMPDTFSSSLILAGLYYGTNYLDRKSSLSNLLAAFGLLLAGTMSKLPSACLLGIFIPIFFLKDITFKRKISLASMLLLVMVPVIIWYFYWVPFLVEEYGFWHFFMGKGMLEGAGEVVAYWNESLKKFYENALMFIGFGAFLAGFFLAFFQRNKKLLTVFCFTFFPFLLIVFKSGATFAFHSYYIIPFVPVMALVSGYALSLIRKRWIVVVILIAIGAEGILNQQHDFRLRESDLPIVDLEQVLDTFSQRNDLILINSGDYPTPLYFAHRKGWIAPNENIVRSAYRDDLVSKGLKYIVILKRAFGTSIEIPEAVVFENENYTIYHLDDR